VASTSTPVAHTPPAGGAHRAPLHNGADFAEHGVCAAFRRARRIALAMNSTPIARRQPRRLLAA